MRKRPRGYSIEEDLNVWPSFTDLMSNAFMIMSLFLLIALFKSLFLKYEADTTKLNLSETEDQVKALENELQQRTNQVEELEGLAVRLRDQLQDQMQESSSEVNELETEIQRLKLAPPVVVIQDSGDYQFGSGSAELPDQLRDYIELELVDKIEQLAAERNFYVVEIIGHTDGQEINRDSNLDSNLEAVASGEKPVSELEPGSNADLGLMRALEVVKELQKLQKEGRLQGLEFRAYSAAQLLLPEGGFAKPNRDPDSSRRRIEIRFSPLGSAETIN